MVSNQSVGWTSPFVLPNGKGTTFQDHFCFLHLIDVLPEVAPGLVSYPQFFVERAKGIDIRIWPGTQHVPLLKRFIILHFAVDDDQ